MVLSRTKNYMDFWRTSWNWCNRYYQFHYRTFVCVVSTIPSTTYVIVTSTHTHAHAHTPAHILTQFKCMYYWNIVASINWKNMVSMQLISTSKSTDCGCARVRAVIHLYVCLTHHRHKKTRPLKPITLEHNPCVLHTLFLTSYGVTQGCLLVMFATYID
jgi:hypothetical protein